MTSTTRAGLPTLLLVLACGMGVRAPVAAATSAQDPTMCTRWGLNTASGVYQLDGSTGFGGIEDDIGHGTDFVCPLVRTQEPGPQGMRVTLTGGFGAT